MLKSKRGAEILTTEVLYLVAALIFIAIIAIGFSRFYGLTSSEKEKSQALGTLERLSFFLSGLKVGESGIFLSYVPKDYYLVYNPSARSKDDPFSCVDKPCACICKDLNCEGENSFCRPIEKQLDLRAVTPAGGKRFIIIATNELTIKNEESSYILTSLTESIEKIADYETIHMPNIEVIKDKPIPAPERATSPKVDRIILHHTARSTFEGAYREFRDNPAQKSAHYIIDKGGTIHYIVDEWRKALHAGNADDYNQRSIGIEIVNNGTEPFTDTQYDSINRLVEDILRRYTLIKLDNQHILGHYETTQGKLDQKSDPSSYFNWTRIGLPNHVPSTVPKL